MYIHTYSMSTATIMLKTTMTMMNTGMAITAGEMVSVVELPCEGDAAQIYKHIYCSVY